MVDKVEKCLNKRIRSPHLIDGTQRDRERSLKRAGQAIKAIRDPRDSTTSLNHFSYSRFLVLGEYGLWPRHVRGAESSERRAAKRDVPAKLRSDPREQNK